MIDFTRPEDIDLDASEKALLETFKRNEGNSLKILLSIYKGYYGKLFLSIVFFAIKHSPVWVLPIVTANIINIATERPDNAGMKIPIINKLRVRREIYEQFQFSPKFIVRDSPFHRASRQRVHRSLR